jgi:hypothetical protein
MVAPSLPATTTRLAARAPSRASLAARLALASTVASAIALVSCSSASEAAPDYRCVKLVDGDAELGGEVTSIGDIAYVGGASTISVFDLSNPSDPQALAPLAFPQRVEAIATGGGRLVAAGAQVLHVFDVSNPRAPSKIGEVMTASIATNALVTDGHWAYAGTPSGTVTVFDVSGAAPVLVTQSASGGPLPISDLLLHDDTLYAAGGVAGSLVPFDVKRREQPVPSPAVAMNGNVNGMAFADGALFAYTTAAGGQLIAHRLDVSAPLAPHDAAKTSLSCGGCEGGGRAVQVTTAHGQFVVPTPYGKGMFSWNFALEGTYDDFAATCFPTRYAISHVHGVGATLVVTGNSAIAFLVP